MNQAVQTEAPFATPAAAIAEDVGRPTGINLTAAPKVSSGPAHYSSAETDHSLFEHFAWLYAFFRERLFRDDTDRFVRTLWPQANPKPGTRLLELGCGPGFYSCGLAARLPELSVLGVDRSARQLTWAEQKAQRLHLENCRFESDDVLDLSHTDETFDVLLAARLFTVLPDQERAIAEMHRVLRPGGQCLIAEPRYALWASLPLFAMWLLAGATGINNGYCEPRRATVLAPAAFKKLFLTQPWRQVKTWQEGRYQYALCEKV
jgi:ubiquinone/menaquinone biosynthesis C-methylase UbiE